MQFSRSQALLIALSAVVGSIIAVVRKHAMMNMDPWRYEVVAGICHVLLIPIYLSLINVSPTLTPVTQGWSGAPWVVLATVLNAVGTVAFLWSLRGTADVGTVSVLASLSPVLTIMFAALFLHQTPSLKQALGVGLVLVGSVIAAGR